MGNYYGLNHMKLPAFYHILPTKMATSFVESFILEYIQNEREEMSTEARILSGKH